MPINLCWLSSEIRCECVKSCKSISWSKGSASVFSSLSPAKPKSRYGNLDGEANERAYDSKCLKKCDVSIRAEVFYQKSVQ